MAHYQEFVWSLRIAKLGVDAPGNRDALIRSLTACLMAENSGSLQQRARPDSSNRPTRPA